MQFSGFCNAGLDKAGCGKVRSDRGGLAVILGRLAIISIALLVGGGVRADDKVRFGTNWLAEPEHGGYYQALADGTYKKYGLDVTILAGGPLANNRLLLSAGKLDFYMGANMIQAFDAVEQGIPTIVVAAMFQKEPQVLMSHPGQGLDSWLDLKKSPLILVSKEGLAGFYQWMKADYGFKEEQTRPYTFNPGPIPVEQEGGTGGLRLLRATCDRKGWRFQAQRLPDGGSGLQRLFDDARDTHRDGREKS